jgi:anti-sigma-K factor RskA
MSCEEISELLAAYAVDALDGETERQVRDHVSTCRKHDEELAGHQAVVSGLAVSDGPIDPPPALRDRLLRAFDDEVIAAERQTAHRRAGEPARVVPFFRRPAYAWLAAAALFVAVVGLTAWNVVLQTGGGEEERWTVSARLSGAGVAGHFWYLDREQLAVVSMDEMPPLETGRVYQAWGIYDGNAVSLGVLPDQHTIAINADLAGAKTFAITAEPMGGSKQPTSDPLAVAHLD